MQGARNNKKDGQNCITKSFIICYLHLIMLGWLNQGKRDGLGEMRNGYKSENIKGRILWEDWT
jgi:hypothetical protein